MSTPALATLQLRVVETRELNPLIRLVRLHAADGARKGQLVEGIGNGARIDAAETLKEIIHESADRRGRV